MKDEVVTHATTRVVEVPELTKPVALITLDNGLDPTKPNTFGREGLSSLDAAFDAALATGPAAIAVTGKPSSFSVGADLAAIGMDRDTTLTIGKRGHDAFRRFTDSAIPTFALVNGVAIGGGLELALACHYRAVASDVPAIGFPECGLGLFQGWGGTQLLPNLVGADHAVTVIIENALNNKLLQPPEALELGIADVLLDPADYLDQSLRWIAGVVDGAIEVPRPEMDRGAAWDAAIVRARGIVEARTHGASPGPARAVELLDFARHNDLDRGYPAESEAMADVLLSDELRASLYAMTLVQFHGVLSQDAPDGAPARPVKRLGIVGAGHEASQLALLAVRQLDIPVVLTDPDQARLDEAVGRVREEVETLLDDERISRDEADRVRSLVSGSPDDEGIRDADFVIETVDEDLSVKQRVLAEVEEHVSAECVLATTTSALSVTEIAGELRHPERLVGFHSANPIAELPLLEVIRADRTDDATVATAEALGDGLGKSCVRVSGAPASVLHRVLARFLGEVVATLDEGTPFEVADHALDSLGLSMSPLDLLQLIGPPVALRVTESLHGCFPDRFAVSANLQRLVEADRTSVWLRDAEGNKTLDPEVAALWRTDSSPSTSADVLDRATAALADEIRRLLDEGVVAEPQDVDRCLILGVGWPFWLGGITPYLDRAGVSERVTGRRFLPQGVANVPAN
ncbi:3-hydroxyacyl-CoA dehydrogenase NAD-binding domain-containing protein [Streptomyces oceani]|uniref:3-hydroxyacyl-CoA dehydrogenase NAD-binding domain-containing protein n=1 Tax=Streptomyces oceani TaxID=1075402 RepID=UPI000A60BC31|nr:3-hydroxyacyl-CoA dehydrogenase NAD-binding domain-containing protein [Streptomyces oceani]